MENRFLYAVVPAAGWSRRMGRPKLLLPLGEKSVITRLLEALDHPQIRCRAVVQRRDDAELFKEVRESGAWAIRPESDPAEMRQSVEIALSAIAERFSPKPEDGWLLVPADHPVLSPQVVAKMVAAWQSTPAEILVPSQGNRRGHPTIFSWELSKRVYDIPPDSGLNWLVRSAETTIEEVPIDDPAIFTDLDTPADYEALKRSFGNES